MYPLRSIWMTPLKVPDSSHDPIFLSAMICDPVHLLKNMIRIPSLSREEKEIADYLENFVKPFNLACQRIENNLVFSLGTGTQTLLLNTHLDVVPPSSNHPFDPFDPVEKDGFIYGRGSVDAKASGATMLSALMQLAADGWKPKEGRVLLALTTCEEIGGEYNGLETVRRHLPPLHAALVGEPTCMEPCVAQKGILILKVVSRGRTAHAARSHLGVNAIHIAGRDLSKIDNLIFERSDPFLGSPTATPTVIEGGTARNVVPDECFFYLDIRSTPAYTHEELIEIIDELLESEVHIHSKRYIPVATSPDETIVKACTTVLPGHPPFGSPTASDWVHLHDVPTVKIGPGPSERSHTPEERIEIEALTEAREKYMNVIKTYFSLLQDED